MVQELARVGLACPRCGAAIIWALRDRGDGPAVEVRHAGCDCQLTRDQWADLAERANTLLNEPHLATPEGEAFARSRGRGEPPEG